MDWPLLLLAAEDYLPVLLSALGLWMLARGASTVDPSAAGYVRAGWGLIVVGGVTKPVYKTVLAVSGGDVDLVVLDALLFWFLAPGFLLVAGGVRWAARADGGLPSGSGRWAALAASGSVVAALAMWMAVEGRAWFFVLLVVATVGNAWMIAELVRWSWVRREQRAAWLFGANLVIVFGLAASASIFEQTIPVQWGEQLASTAAQGLFLWAAIRLVRSIEQEPLSAAAASR